VTLTTTRPLVFDRYTDNRATGSFILIDPATNFTAGAGMITGAVLEQAANVARPSAAERLVQIARGASSEAEAIELVRLALEDILK
jgi:sulfate adenylyltransferase subunit 1 (EFTu-like GTPase family)